MTRIRLIHSDPIVNIGLATLCDNLVGVILCRDEEQGPGIVIADYQRGLDLTRRREFDQARILVITHYNKEGEIRRALQSGIHGYLLQNCVLDELKPAITALSCGQSYLSEDAKRIIDNSWNRAELTCRESDVLQLLGKGYGNKAIARELGIKEQTVKSHLKHMMSKLDVSARTQAVAVANQRGLLTME